MKKLLTVVLITSLLLSGSAVSIFASSEHTHVWSDWEIEEESTCSERGSEYRYCKECGEYEYRDLPLAAHEWDSWEVIRRATPYKKGIKARYCMVCDEEQTKTISKKKLTNNQKRAIKVVKTYLKAAKSYNVKRMNSCFKKRGKNYGYPTKKIDWVYKKYNKKIKWTMVDVTGKGSTIKVKVKVTRPDFYTQAYKAFYETCKWGIYHSNANSTTLGRKILNKYNAKVKKCTKKTSTDTVTFTIVKSGKNWKIKAKTKTIVDIATAFYWEGTDDAYDDFLSDYS